MWARKVKAHVSIKVETLHLNPVSQWEVKLHAKSRQWKPETPLEPGYQEHLKRQESFLIKRQEETRARGQKVFLATYPHQEPGPPSSNWRSYPALIQVNPLLLLWQELPPTLTAEHNNGDFLRRSHRKVPSVAAGS